MTRPAQYLMVVVLSAAVGVATAVAIRSVYTGPVVQPAELVPV